jgi:mannose-6-phosphate isomerase-like protein (cupin superfamily)
MNTASASYLSYSVGGGRYTVLLTGAETEGAYAVFDCLVPPGLGASPHLHRREDEAFYVIDGEFEFTIAGEPARVSSGAFLFGRRGVPHHFKNIGSTPGRMIITVTPRGLRGFFAEIGTLLGSREDAPIPPTPEDIEKLLQTAPKYGVEMLPNH